MAVVLHAHTRAPIAIAKALPATRTTRSNLNSKRAFRAQIVATGAANNSAKSAAAEEVDRPAGGSKATTPPSAQAVRESQTLDLPASCSLHISPRAAAVIDHRAAAWRSGGWISAGGGVGNRVGTFLIPFWILPHTAGALCGGVLVGSGSGKLKVQTLQVD